MTWEDFESEREARNFGAEMYKQLIIKYFQTQGYFLRKNSLFEGTLPDIVMEKDSRIIWIEAKNTKVSIFSKSDPLKRELYEYFYYWLQSNEKDRFNLIIFVVNMAKKEETKKILTKKAKELEIIKWFREKEDIKIDENVLEKVESANKVDIVNFFKSISVKICSPFELSQRVSKREQELRKSFNAYHSKLLRETKNRKDPNRKRTEIIINFMELEYPQTFWQVTSKYRLKKTIYKKLNPDRNFSVRLPAFVIPRFENIIPVVRSFDKELGCLRPYIIGEIYDQETRFLDIKRKQKLIYESLRRFLWCKGLRRYGNIYYFTYETPLKSKPKEKVAPIEIEGPKKPKIVSTPRYNNNGRLNFVEHHSIEIKLTELDEELGLSIWPGFFFTYNGICPVKGDHANRLHQKYLNPDWNRNPNKRSLLKFWEHFLINNQFIREKDNWFDKFRIKPLTRETISWTSETVELNQDRIDLFF